MQEHFARLYLIELLTGTHPATCPGPLRLPERRSQDYAEFTFTLPEPMARCLHQRASYLLSHAGIHEPVTWEPPFDWVTGVSWPGTHPDDISPEGLHPLIRSGLPVRAIAARLGTTAGARPAHRGTPPGTPTSIRQSRAGPASARAT